MHKRDIPVQWPLSTNISPLDDENSLGGHAIIAMADAVRARGALHCYYWRWNFSVECVRCVMCVCAGCP